MADFDELLLLLLVLLRQYTYMLIYHGCCMHVAPSAPLGVLTLTDCCSGDGTEARATAIGNMKHVCGGSYAASAGNLVLMTNRDEGFASGRSQPRSYGKAR